MLATLDEAQSAGRITAGAGATVVERATTRSRHRRKQNDDAQRLQQIVDDYFEQYLALHPLRATELGDHRFDDRFGDYASPSWMADSLGIEQESLEKLAAVDPRKLRREQFVAYDAFKRQRELNIGGYRYPSELLAIDPFASPAEEFAAARVRSRFTSVPERRATTIISLPAWTASLHGSTRRSTTCAPA